MQSVNIFQCAHVGTAYNFGALHKNSCFWKVLSDDVTASNLGCLFAECVLSIEI
jgi:hypothetical protein